MQQILVYYHAMIYVYSVLYETSELVCAADQCFSSPAPGASKVTSRLKRYSPSWSQMYEIGLNLGSFWMLAQSVSLSGYMLKTGSHVDADNY